MKVIQDPIFNSITIYYEGDWSIEGSKECPCAIRHYCNGIEKYLSQNGYGVYPRMDLIIDNINHCIECRAPITKEFKFLLFMLNKND